VASSNIAFFAVSLEVADRLASLLARFALRARVFNSGPLCRTVHFDTAEGVGHVHVILRGSVRVENAGEPAFDVVEPTLLFYVRPTTHRLVVATPGDADTVCASIDFGALAGNPLAAALPRLLLIPIAQLPGLARTVELLFDEAFSERCGRQAALDRLCELLVIQLLRHLLDAEPARGGLLAGLADPRLAKALNAVHEEPARDWSLERLAERAGMSRARFAVTFRETLGATPGEYLAQWRLGLAQSLLRRGRPVAVVASEVGYSGAAALSRAFRARFGTTPTQWRRQDAGQAVSPDTPRRGG
jgi:AraC-like DNA-binding protein